MPPRSEKAQPAPTGSAQGRRKDPDDGPRTWPVRRTTSAGGVVIRENDEPSVVLIRHTSLKGETVWALPKGQLEPGEQPQDAALREVLEETGLEAEIVGELDHISYWFAWPPERVRYHKTVHFFLMRMRGGDPAAHDSEVEEVAFVSLAEAPRRATHSSERELLQRAAEVVAAW